VSLYDDAELTCQFMLEDHAVRHSYHHLARLRRTAPPAKRSSANAVSALKPEPWACTLSTECW
jgi:hypothetical protein